MPPIALAIRTIYLPKSFSYPLVSDYPVCIDPKPANAEIRPVVGFTVSPGGWLMTCLALLTAAWTVLGLKVFNDH